MKKQLIVTALIFLALVIGCTKQGSAGIAGTAASVSIPGRIISAAPSNTEIIVGLGLADRLIAVDPYSKDIPGVRQDLPEVDFFYPDAEAIIGLEPEIIIANEINNFGATDSPFRPLMDIDIKVVQIPTSTNLAGIYGDIVTIAEVLGVKDRGEVLTTDLRAEVNKIAEIGKTVTDKKKVYYEISPAPQMVTFGSGTYLNEMIEIIGGVNIFADQHGWFSPNAEEIIKRNPDVIFTMEMTTFGVDSAAKLRTRQSFESINAIKENRIYGIDGNSSGRPSQNIILALKQMALAVYPEIYEAD
ncbi:ABC transporter substrate-binding protein [Leadbettera azotonutricia]|uniref:Periplasmic binding protein n=1 Tax=Leadbettera azotonutricia (strain ATCC BAA-888 / DSM 13862 / ZAS-9) TaxID=545695 RepID=F5Y849_LEAAZ|nr:ABC transporter substrate-binding protein [Leadbettera azotonutricia]AEF81600.1 periplasmic binding protein [Leadbettera azotonutricia ZAS-9]